MYLGSSQVLRLAFLSKLHTVYVFSSSRSGDTAEEVLGGTTGSLTIDGYTGYDVARDSTSSSTSSWWSGS